MAVVARRGKTKATEPVAPPPNPVDEWIEKLKKDGKVIVPDPDGTGFYHISIIDRPYYGTPGVWHAYGKEGDKIDGMAWRVIPWYVNYAGKHISPAPQYGAPRWGAANLQDHLPLARIVIGVILSGRKLKSLTCGSSISSLNSNAT